MFPSVFLTITCILLLGEFFTTIRYSVVANTWPPTKRPTPTPSSPPSSSPTLRPTLSPTTYPPTVLQSRTSSRPSTTRTPTLSPSRRSPSNSPSLLPTTTTTPFPLSNNSTAGTTSITPTLSPTYIFTPLETDMEVVCTLLRGGIESTDSKCSYDMPGTLPASITVSQEIGNDKKITTTATVTISQVEGVGWVGVGVRGGTIRVTALIFPLPCDLITSNANANTVYTYPSDAFFSTIATLDALVTLKVGCNNLPSRINVLQGLTGSIPPTIGTLTNLKSLDLRNNGLSGNIPQSFQQLSRLEFISLNGNGKFTDLKNDAPDPSSWEGTITGSIPCASFEKLNLALEPNFGSACFPKCQTLLAHSLYKYWMKRIFQSKSARYTLSSSVPQPCSDACTATQYADCSNPQTVTCESCPSGFVAPRFSTSKNDCFAVVTNIVLRLWHCLHPFISSWSLWYMVGSTSHHLGEQSE